MRVSVLSAGVLGTVLAGLSASVADQRGGKGALEGYDVLLQYEAVQKELKLTEQQLIKVKEIINQTRRQQQKNLEGLLNIKPEERKSKAKEVLEKVSAATWLKLPAILKTDQLKRLEQIKLQLGGLSSLLLPETESALKLTNEQKKHMATIVDGQARVRPDSRTGGKSTSFHDGLDRDHELRKAEIARALEVLTPAQRSAWQELVGPPFKIRATRSIGREAPDRTPRR